MAAASGVGWRGGRGQRRRRGASGERMRPLAVPFAALRRRRAAVVRQRPAAADGAAARPAWDPAACGSGGIRRRGRQAAVSRPAGRLGSRSSLRSQGPAGGNGLQLRAEVEDLAGPGLDLGRRRARRGLREELRLLEQRDQTAGVGGSRRAPRARAACPCPCAMVFTSNCVSHVSSGSSLRHVVDDLQRAAETRTCARARSCSRR